MKRLDLPGFCAALVSLPSPVAILTHERADADTLGSALALAELLAALGVRAKICSPDGIPERLAFLGCVPGEPEEGDTLVSVDVPSVEQLGRYASLASRVVLMADHHRMGDAYADGLVDAGAAAVGEIILDAARLLSDEGRVAAALPTAFYTAVYAAISSDTGGFRYSNVTPETHLRAAELLRHGIDAAEINRQLFDSHSPAEVAANRLAYSALRLYADGRFGVITFTRAMQHECGAGARELGGIIDIPRGVRGVVAAAVLKQSEEDGRLFRISLRSNTDFDVAAVAAAFGGGGHLRAAGASLVADSPEEAEALLTEKVTDALREQGQA